MDALTFFGLVPAGEPAAPGEPAHWRMPIVPGIISGNGSLYGGCGLGAGIEVMEQATGRPCVWATAQYLSFARPPDVLDLEVREVVRGHQISQARVLARVGDNEIITVVGALGRRPMPDEGQWSQLPDVAPPEDCPPRHLNRSQKGTISERLDTRLALGRRPDDFDGRPGSSQSALWVRVPGALDPSAAMLAIIGDFVPFGVSQALGIRSGGRSLDNTLRVAHRSPTEWVLADVRIHAVADGFAHGLVHLWAQDGTLLGTASQSAKMRVHQPDQEARP